VRSGSRRQPMHIAIPSSARSKNAPWNKGRLIGQKRPLKPKDVWAIRVRLQLEGRKRDLALFNLAIDSKLRRCDLVRLQVNDVLRRRQGSRTWHRDPNEDGPAGPVLNHPRHSGLGPGLALRGPAQKWLLPLPEPFPAKAAPLDPAVCAHCPWLDQECRARQHGIRHALDAPNESGTDLQENW
jgi:hypothetical protein